MAFAARNLSVLAYANGFTLWHYKAEPDDFKHVGHSGFFAGADDILSTGDMMMVSAVGGARLMCLVADGGTLCAKHLT